MACRPPTPSSIRQDPSLSSLHQTVQGRKHVLARGASTRGPMHVLRTVHKVNDTVRPNWQVLSIMDVKCRPACVLLDWKLHQPIPPAQAGRPHPAAAFAALKS